MFQQVVKGNKIDDAYKLVDDAYKQVDDAYKLVDDAYKLVVDAYKLVDDAYKLVVFFCQGQIYDVLHVIHGVYRELRGDIITVTTIT